MAGMLLELIANTQGEPILIFSKEEGKIQDGEQVLHKDPEHPLVPIVQEAGALGNN